MNHLVPLVRPLFEKLHIFRGVDGRGLGQHLFLLVYLINLIGDQIYAIPVGLILQDDMKGIVIYMIAFDQLRAEIAGAVRAQDNLVRQRISSLTLNDCRKSCLSYHKCMNFSRWEEKTVNSQRLYRAAAFCFSAEASIGPPQRPAVRPECRRLYSAGFRRRQNADRR